MHRFTSVKSAPDASGEGGVPAGIPEPPLAPAMPAAIPLSGAASAAARWGPRDSEASFKLTPGAGSRADDALRSPMPRAQRKYPTLASARQTTMLFRIVTRHLHSSADSAHRTRAV